MATALTMIRLALVVPLAIFMANGDQRHAIFALAALVVALVTDFLDGPIARRTGTVSAFGGTFDPHYRFPLCHLRSVCRSQPRRFPVDPAHLDCGSLCAIFHRLLLDS
jgi:hypothetical protein